MMSKVNCFYSAPPPFINVYQMKLSVCSGCISILGRRKVTLGFFLSTGASAETFRCPCDTWTMLDKQHHYEISIKLS